VLAWNDKGGTVRYKISGMRAFEAPTTFDTGEPATTLYTGGIPKSLTRDGNLKSGLTFSAKLGARQVWRFQMGTRPNVNQVDVGSAHEPAAVNSGIGLFLHYDVMYDIQDGVIGFRRAC
jgi:hypothetical protein